MRGCLRSYCGARTATVWQNADGDLVGDEGSDLDDPRPLGLLRGLRSVVPVKTHRLIDAEDPIPAVYIVRDGRDALVSYAHFLLRKDGVEDPDVGLVHDRMGSLLDGNKAFGSWSESVQTWLDRKGATHLVRYEDLIAAPIEVSRQAASFLGLPLPPLQANALPPRFSALQARNPTLFRRGIAGAWKTEMPPGIEEQFWKMHGQAMTRLGYEREAAESRQ
jgi:hypothetical protein